jgi:hypothetical protein
MLIVEVAMGARGIEQSGREREMPNFEPSLIPRSNDFPLSRE